MGQRLQPDHPGLKRIQELFEHHLSNQISKADDEEREEIRKNLENPFVKSMLPSSNGMDKYRTEIPAPAQPEFIRQLTQEKS